MSDWKELPLNDVIELVIDHRGKTPKKLGFDDFFSEGYPVLSAKHVKTSGLVNLDAMRFANEEMYKKWMKEPTQKGDVILTSEAPLGELFYIDGSKKYVLGQRVFGLRPKSDVLDSMYLLVWLSSAEGQGRLQARATGSTVQGIKQSELLKIMIPIPPMEVQKDIASIYGSLDQKIHLNTQINQTLEQIAQSLFKSWFVDFDPVRAKVQALSNGMSLEQAELAAMQAISGKTPEELTALSQTQPDRYAELAETAKAFPCEMVEVDGVEVPKGWGVKRIDEIANIIKGKSYKSSELEKSKTALVTLKSFNSGGGYRLDGLKEYTGKYKPEQEVFAGELIIAYTDVTQAADVIGKPAMVMSDSNYQHLVISLDVGVVRPFNDVYKHFLYCLAMTDSFQAHTKSFCTGTTVLHLGKDAVPSFEFINPSNELLHVFYKQTSLIFEKINLHIEENKNLEKARDLLLPRLLNGEI